MESMRSRVPLPAAFLLASIVPPVALWLVALVYGQRSSWSLLGFIYVWAVGLIPALVLVGLPMLVVPRLRRPSASVAALWGMLAALAGAEAIFLQPARELLRADVLMPLATCGLLAGLTYSTLAGFKRRR